MKRLMAGAVLGVLGLIFVGRPAAAQVQDPVQLATPVYFAPKGGTGLTIDGDFGRVASLKLDDVPASFKPVAYGGRVYLGLPIVTVGLGVAVYDSRITTVKKSSQYGGSAAFKVFGGPLIPIAVSLQAGVGYEKQGTGTFATKFVSVPLGLGFAVNVPTPGVSLEPWAAARAHINSVKSGTASTTQTGYGLSGGINFGLPIGLGAHVALDWSRFGRKTSGTLNLPKREALVVGVGLHYMIKLPGLPGVPVVPGV